MVKRTPKKLICGGNSNFTQTQENGVSPTLGRPNNLKGGEYMKIYPMDDDRIKRLELGSKAKVLLDLYLENPKKFHAEFVLEQLLKEYEKQEKKQ